METLGTRAPEGWESAGVGWRVGVLLSAASNPEGKGHCSEEERLGFGEELLFTLNDQITG